VTSYTQRTIQALQAAGPFGLSGNARNIILAQEMINIKAWFGIIFSLYFIENLNQVTIKMIIILIELRKMKKMRLLN
jgi:hypothetical protein